jgi:hypothetical protein
LFSIFLYPFDPFFLPLPCPCLRKICLLRCGVM